MKPETTRVDVARRFGPLAAMHAALDAADCGMPCGFTVRLQKCSERTARARLQLALLQFPVLRMRLLSVEGRPTLERALASPVASETSLSFKAFGAQSLWRCVLEPDGADTLVSAVFSHAAADGASMLRLVAVLQGAADAPECPPARTATPPALLSWTPGFLFEEARPALALAPEALAPPGVSFVRAGPADRDAFLNAACADRLGGAPLLAAAASLAARTLSASPQRARIALNIPIARADLAEVGGFGFGVGSLLLRETLAGGDTLQPLALRLRGKIRRRADTGWDLGLERFLGEDPRRHRRFAAIRRAAPPDPTLNISWKGLVKDGERPTRAQDLVCFAAAPTAHLSAHADADGFSLSLTAPRTPDLRAAFLEEVCGRLGLSRPREIRRAL